MRYFLYQFDITPQTVSPTFKKKSYFIALGSISTKGLLSIYNGNYLRACGKKNEFL